MQQIVETTVMCVVGGATLLGIVFFLSSCDIEYRKHYLSQTPEQHCATQGLHNQTEFCRNYKDK